MGHKGDRDRKEKDHRYPSEYPHAFRRQWPAKKARRHRQERHHARMMLQHADDPSINEDLLIEPVHRGHLRKWAAIPLREWIAERLEGRVGRYGWNLLWRRPYDPEELEQYEAMIRTVCEGSDRALAEEFARRIDEDLPNATLDALFGARPELELLLRDFIARCLAR